MATKEEKKINRYSKRQRFKMEILHLQFFSQQIL